MKKVVPSPIPPPELDADSDPTPTPTESESTPPAAPAFPSATMSPEKFLRGLIALNKISDMIETNPGIAKVH